MKLMHVYRVPEITNGDYFYVAEALLWVEETYIEGEYRFEYGKNEDPQDSLPVAFHLADASALAVIRGMIEA